LQSVACVASALDTESRMTGQEGRRLCSVLRQLTRRLPSEQEETGAVRGALTWEISSNVVSEC